MPRRSTRSRPARCATPPTASAFIAELRERFALSARVLDGEEEARLTYLGATAEQPAGGADPGDRHRRRLDRADRRHRRGDRLPRLAAGRRRPPHRAPHLRRPADQPSSWRRSPPTSRSLIEAASPNASGEAHSRGRDRRRRHADLAGRDRAGPRALRPRARARARPHPAVDPATALAASPLRLCRSESRSPGCTRTGRPTIVAGVVILIEAMRAFGLDRVEVSEHDILYGAAIAAAARRPDGHLENLLIPWDPVYTFTERRLTYGQIGRLNP